MIGARVFMKEKLSKSQYILLIGIVAGSVLVIIDTVL
jgi:drug/metabolite transporter (DMT)-like permease